MAKNLIKGMLQKQVGQQVREIGSSPCAERLKKATPMHMRPLREQLFPKGKSFGDYVPVYVALGMISLSTTLGLHAATQHLAYDPEVHLNKARRETIPEIVEPEKVTHESEEYIRKSLFRKVAHVQEFQTALPEPIHRTCLLEKEPAVESLKEIGVEPVLDNGLRR